MPKRIRNPEPVRRASKKYKEKTRTERPEVWRSIMDKRNAAARRRREDAVDRAAIQAKERARYARRAVMSRSKKANDDGYGMQKPEPRRQPEKQPLQSIALTPLEPNAEVDLDELLEDLDDLG